MAIEAAEVFGYERRVDGQCDVTFQAKMRASRARSVVEKVDGIVVRRSWMLVNRCRGLAAATSLTPHIRLRINRISGQLSQPRLMAANRKEHPRSVIVGI
jgi:hypothetical protein